MGVWTCPRCGRPFGRAERGKVAELRPLTKWEAMWFPSARQLRDRRITRTPSPTGAGWWYVANLRTPDDVDDVDDTVRDWLTEAYESADD